MENTWMGCGHRRPKLLIKKQLCSVSAVLSFAFILGCSGSASDYVQEGTKYLDKGDLAAALISFKNAVQADPASTVARLALADTLERNGDLPGAEQQLRRAIDAGGDLDELVPRIAVLLLDRGENALLIRDFGGRKLKSAAADSDLKALVGLAQLAAGQPKKAGEQIEQAGRVTPAIRLARAQIAFTANQRAEAAAEMEEVLKSETVPWWVARAASRVFAGNGELDKALQAIKKAYEAAPMHRGVIGEYAEQLIAANRKEEARPLRDKLLKLAPGYYRTQYLNALFLLEDGKQDLAYTAITKVLAALPAHIPSQLMAATLELEKNELASVETRVKRILSADPNSAEGYRLLANLEVRRGNLAAAGLALDRAMARSPEDRGLLALSANLAWKKGDKAGAIALIKKAAERDPASSELLIRYAEFLVKAGKENDALQPLNRASMAIKTDQERELVFKSAIAMKQWDLAQKLVDEQIQSRPKDPGVVMWQAIWEGAQGHEDRALEQTRKALSLDATYFPALSALAGAASSADRSKEYAERLQKAVDAGGKDPRIYLALAAVMRSAKAPAEKIATMLEQGLIKETGSLPLREATIRQWLDAGRKDRALVLARDGEAVMPDNMAMQALSASIHELAGETAQASIKYAQLADRFPDRLDWNLKHARNLAANGKQNEAIKVLRRLIQERPEEPLPYQALVALQLDQKLYKEAQLTAEMLRDKPRQKAAGLLLLGDVYGAADRTSEAVKTYNAAADAGMGDTAIIRKIKMLDRTGSGVQAATELSKWLAKSPNNVPALSLAANRASAHGDYAMAARHLESVVRQDPKNSVALNDLAWAYVMAKDSRALEIAERAALLSSDNAVVLDTLAQALWLAGKRDDALASVRKALGVDPANAIVQVHLAEFLVQSGKRSEAAGIVAMVDSKRLDIEAAKRLRELKEKL
ncbi:MAG TPA: XrtA/PEP-CTERM system TPR-repeat protein PrsT [Azonexus sp.]|nr:XrtA/PEP-CTERM system TPR-repeat protein PrsT [Azonexus sp.]